LPEIPKNILPNITVSINRHGKRDKEGIKKLINYLDKHSLLNVFVLGVAIKFLPPSEVLPLLQRFPNIENIEREVLLKNITISIETHGKTDRKGVKELLLYLHKKDLLNKGVLGAGITAFPPSEIVNLFEKITPLPELLENILSNITISIKTHGKADRKGAEKLLLYLSDKNLLNEITLRVVIEVLSAEDAEFLVWKVNSPFDPTPLDNNAWQETYKKLIDKIVSEDLSLPSIKTASLYFDKTGLSLEHDKEAEGINLHNSSYKVQAVGIYLLLKKKQQSNNPPKHMKIVVGKNTNSKNRPRSHSVEEGIKFINEKIKGQYTARKDKDNPGIIALEKLQA